jgi:hypothetical protein
VADYSDLDPTALRASLSDGTRLKKSITTDLYTSGTPTAANQVKPSIMYPSGTLKESVANAAGLKPSWLIAGAVAVNNDFITEWSITDNGTAAQRTITLPTTGTGYLDTTIDWGDGTVETGLADADLPFTHEYTAGSGTTTPTITVSIGESGAFPRWYFNNGGDKDKITEVTNWGTIGIASMNNALNGCSNLTGLASNAWDVADCSGAFNGTSSLTTIPVDLFALSASATNYSFVFYNSGITAIPAGLLANSPLATTVHNAFFGTPITAVPTDLFRYNTALTDISRAFQDCTSLTIVNSGVFQYNTAVTTYLACFDGCTALVDFKTTIPAGSLAIVAFGALGFFWDNSTVNSTDYNALLADLYAQSSTGGGPGITSGIIFDAGSSVATGQGVTDRNSIASNDSWTFQDSTP